MCQTQKTITVVDVHCHLGKVLDCSACKDLHSALEGLVSSPEDHILEYIVSNQCFGNQWRAVRGLERLGTDKRVFFTIGLHPRFVKRDTMWGDLLLIKELLDCPKVIGLRECGLDFSDQDITDNTKELQQQVLELLLPLVKIPSPHSATRAWPWDHPNLH